MVDVIHLKSRFQFLGVGTVAAVAFFRENRANLGFEKREGVGIRSIRERSRREESAERQERKE